MSGEALFFLVTAILILIRHIGLYRIFQKAGHDGWKAFIPVLYTFIWLDIIGKPRWWFIWFLIPGINVLMSMIISVDLAKVFGRFTLLDHALAAIFPFFYFIYLGFSKEPAYIGPVEAAKHRRSQLREWIDAIAFAVIAATIIRSFFIEAYTIPTPSMEETLLVDDFLFVSKLNYGPRVPMTPISFPLAHNTMPVFGGKSYLEWPRIPYYRIPGWEKIENGNIVVFNWPKDEARPIDKRDNYIKRCIGIPGDTMEIVNTEVLINSDTMHLPAEAQFLYKVGANTSYFPIPPKVMEELTIKRDEIGSLPQDPQTNFTYYRMFLTKHAAEEIKKLPNITIVEPFIFDKGVYQDEMFPRYAGLPWNVDNFGPLYIPKAGDAIPMNVKNYHIYKEAIVNYEGNSSLELKDSTVYIGGQPVTEYTFTMNYYFMMGDNRHNSYDSRMWGFVPENHIVGKPLFIWLSLDRADGNFNIRWSRMFSGI